MFLHLLIVWHLVPLFTKFSISNLALYEAFLLPLFDRLNVLGDTHASFLCHFLFYCRSFLITNRHTLCKSYLVFFLYQFMVIFTVFSSKTYLADEFFRFLNLFLFLFIVILTSLWVDPRGMIHSGWWWFWRFLILKCINFGVDWIQTRLQLLAYFSSLFKFMFTNIGFHICSIDCFGLVFINVYIYIDPFRFNCRRSIHKPFLHSELSGF